MDINFLTTPIKEEKVIDEILYGKNGVYKMTHVPLKVGVKINPDDDLYSA